ncbi:MAG: putative transport system permease protein [Acidobacteriota bacterium]|jgi:putative ABC transport system permease protein|nr:putative transport system permease protein [Acidobacteriota bacterium]
MDFAELFSEALRAIRTHALRSFLTLLGIVIGVATLVGVISVISGLNVFVRDKLFGLAPDVFAVSKFGLIRGHDEFIEALKRPDVDWEDFQRLRTELKLAEQVGTRVQGTGPVKFRDRRLGNVAVNGTTANFASLMNLDLAAGRFFLDSEARTAQPVAVIGWDVKDELYPQLDPIGREILVEGVPFRVVGLLTQQGRTLGQSRDNVVMVPIDTYRKTFGSHDSLDVLIQARGGVEGVDAAVDEVRGVMRAMRHTDFRAPDPFGIVTAESLQEVWRQVSTAAFLLTVLIASVSLGVGGIVIMNIMLVAVAERTQEIGLRRALGARQRDVRRQFLLEASLLSLAGGVAGVLVGALVTLGVDRLAHFPANLTPGIAALGLGLSLVVGLAAGYWPAVHASNLLPVDALRAE